MSVAPAPYYGGTGADLGTVSALSQTNFSAFVKEVLGNPALVTTHSRAEYQALPKEQRHASKRVPYFTPAAFKTIRSKRNYESAVHCNLLCLDIDDSDQAAPLVARPQSLVERLSPYAFAAYTTASSTKDRPRLRVVVSASAVSLERYGEAVRWVGEVLLGLSNVTGESKVAVQPMYLPTLFRGDDPVDNHPLITAVPEGAAVTAAAVVGAAAPSGNFTSAPDTANDTEALNFLRPSVEGITLEDVANALEHLDPDCTYVEWIEVAAALRHQFPVEPEATQAYDLFNKWSSKGDKYPGEEEVAAKWSSFKSNPRGRLPVTMRSVFRRAASAGWRQAEQIATRCYDQIAGWMQSSERTGNELLEQGVARIVAAPLLSSLQKGTLLSTLHEALSSRHLRVTRTELKHAMHRIERAAAKHDMGAATATPDAQLPQWARGICYVAGQDEFFQRHTGRNFKPQVLDAYYSVQLMTPTDVDSGQPVLRPRDYLLNVLKCPRVDDYMYDPAHPEMFIGNGKKRAVNLYIPTHPEPDATDADAAGEVFYDHIHHLIEEPEYQQLLLDFLAYHVQCPGGKIRWATLVQGAQGCGKTVIAEAMRAVLGREHVRSIGAELIFTGFNGWAMGAQLVAIEEIRVVGHNRYEVMNSLKPCISNDYISINDKNIRAFQTKNVSNYLMFTNHHDSLAVSPGDRRYFVLNSPLQSALEVSELPSGYFDRLWDVVRNRAAGLRAWLEQWELSTNFNPHGHAPVTKYLKELSEASASPLTAAFVDILKDNLHPLVQEDLISVQCLKQLLDTRHLPHFTDQTLAMLLREQGYILLHRMTIEGERHRIWAKMNSKFVTREKSVPGEVMMRLQGRTAEVLDFSVLD